MQLEHPREGMTADAPRGFPLALGTERFGLLTLRHPLIGAAVFVALAIAAAFGVLRIKADDLLSQLFRSNTPEFQQYEEVTRRFPSSEYDVLVVVEGATLLERDHLAKLRDVVTDLQLVDGTRGIISLFSAREPPERGGSIPEPLFPEELPQGAHLRCAHQQGDEQRDHPRQAVVARRSAGADRAGARSGSGLDGPCEGRGRSPQDGSRRPRRHRAQGRAVRRSGDAARYPQRHGARPHCLQCARLRRRLPHRHRVLPAGLVHADCGRAAAHRHPLVAWRAWLARLPPQHLPERDDAADHGDQLLRQHAADLSRT